MLHLLSIASLNLTQIEDLLSLADRYARDIRNKVPITETLTGKVVAIMFFENSTRTRASFEIAATRLGARTVVMDEASSSTRKGETLVDTAMTLRAMQIDVLVIRHPASGATHLLSQKLNGCSIINAGDGTHEHPTQALLDALTIRNHTHTFAGLEVALCGDVAHSRVARSNIALLTMLGARVRLVGPPQLVPPELARENVTIYTDMDLGIRDVDIVIMLRLQNERMRSGLIPSKREYYRYYGLSPERLALAKPDARVMHPGPINRGVEIHPIVAENIGRSLVYEQVEMGVAVRMACLSRLTGATVPVEQQDAAQKSIHG